MLMLQLRPTRLLSSATSSSSSTTPLFPLQGFRHFSAPLVSRRPRPFPLCCCNRLPTATIATEEDEDGEEEEEEEEEEEKEADFIEVGYISKVHGLRGELRVKPSTDFPHLRFSKPGKRWLRSRVSGREVVSQVELTGGRDHPGQKSWIITLRGIDSVEQAKQLVGSTLLVREVDRPELEQGEFYTYDLVGMRVFLKETGKLVGVVANVFNYGASDILQVLPSSTHESPNHSNPSKSDVGVSCHVMWVPFVGAIVPEVDMNRREMLITPPKGLLELNLRTDMRSKKERRQLQWKERKKLQHRLTIAKKNLSEMGQDHLLECLKVAGKPHKSLLIKQIVDINFKLFQHAVQSIGVPSDRYYLSITDNFAVLKKNALEVSSECLNFCESEENTVLDHELHKEGIKLLEQSKAAIIVLMNNEVNASETTEIGSVCISTPEAKLLQIQEVLLDYERLLKVEQAIPITLILVCPTHEIQYYEELLLEREHYGLDNQKVWILEEEKLPLIGASSDSKKILMKSSCEVLQASTGSGGVFSLLASHNIIDRLIEMGVEYVQICGLGGRCRPCATESLYMFGLVKSRDAAMAINMRAESSDDDEFDMIFSVHHLDKMCKQTNKQHIVAVPERHAHMELVKVEGDYAEQMHSVPDEPNSYRFLHSSIKHTAITSCSVDSICAVYFTSRK